MILVASCYRHDEKLRYQEISLAIKPYSLELCDMWYEAPSYSNHIFSRSHSSIAGKKVNWEIFVRKIDVHHLLFKYPFRDVMNSQLASVVTLAWLYMDIGVDLNAKYAIMCRKSVLIPEHDDSDIFSGTSETMMDMSFNICNHYSLFKFLHNCLRSLTIM